jgi:hypothetical protein
MMDELPDEFRSAPYVGARFPGSAAVRDRPGLALGANCQLFAYAVLRHFGLGPPELRSSELWADTTSTVVVATAERLDLLLFNASADPFGAHIGVFSGADRIVHLGAEVGRPAVWSWRDFRARPRYRTLVGIKRVIRRIPG